ncbi:MAG TPA: hypothetical protein VGL39_27630 [Jatrophihabitantaceae bacterium]|jgi:hypothetical protein
MKALTVQPPWSWAIIHGGKSVENRTQNWSYRGPLAIHAGARWSERGAAFLPLRTAWWNEHDCCADGEPVPDEPLPRDLFDPEDFGAIIGVVDLVDVHWADDCWGPIGGHCSPWAEGIDARGGDKPIAHLVLTNPRAVDPIPCPGRLGLWTLPPDIEEVLRA